MALITKLTTNSSMKLMTTDSLTASPTPFGPPGGVHALVAGHDRGDQSEHERLGHALPEVRQLGQGREARQIGARRAVLEDDVEDVAAGHADHRDEAVEEDRDEHAGEHPRDHEPLDRVDAEHHHRVELFADLAGAEVGGDGGAGGAGDQQRRGDRSGLADDGEDGGRAGERLRAELLDQAAHLERDDRAERDGDQCGRDDRHRGDEPGLLEELAGLEGTPEQSPADIEAEGEELARGPDRREDARCGRGCHLVRP